MATPLSPLAEIRFAELLPVPPTVVVVAPPTISMPFRLLPRAGRTVGRQANGIAGDDRSRSVPTSADRPRRRRLLDIALPSAASPLPSALVPTRVNADAPAISTPASALPRAVKSVWPPEPIVVALNDGAGMAALPTSTPEAGVAGNQVASPSSRAAQHVASATAPE